MSIEIAELAFLIMCSKTVAGVDCKEAARSTDLPAKEWEEAKRRTLNRLEDQIAFKTKQVEKGPR